MIFTISACAGVKLLLSAHDIYPTQPAVEYDDLTHYKFSITFHKSLPAIVFLPDWKPSACHRLVTQEYSGRTGLTPSNFHYFRYSVVHPPIQSHFPLFQSSFPVSYEIAFVTVCSILCVLYSIYVKSN